MIAVGRDHEHDTVTIGSGACDRAAGADDLVVGVGVEADQRCHAIVRRFLRQPA
jgi:hypothetical protein